MTVRVDNIDAKDLDDLAEIDGATIIGAGDALVGEVMSGKTFYAGSTTLKTGTLPTQTLSAANDTVNAGYYAATTLHAVDADLAVGNIATGKTIFGITGTYDTSATPIAATRMKTGDEGWVNGSKITGTGTKTLSAANSTVAEGYYAATTLQAVDTDLAGGNIKTGTNIFGFTGTYDTSATPILAADIKTGEEGWVNGAKVTGSGTKTLSTANDTVAAGYYAATTLHAVDADLAAANIKNAVNIFGIAGTYDYEAANPVVAGRMKTGDVAFVNGTKITGTGTQTLSTANDTVAAGYYAATTLHAVDADLAAANIKSGVVIFGITGTLASTLSEDATGSDDTAETAAGIGGYLQTININATSEYDLATKTVTFSASSMAVAVGYANIRSEDSSMYLRLYMDGVLVTTSADIYTSGHSNNVIVVGTKALSGSKICKIAVYNGQAGTRSVTLGGGYASGDVASAGIAVGSIKVA